MSEMPVEIKGGAGEFEAAVIAVVLDRMAREEAVARSGRRSQLSGLPAWVRAVQPDRDGVPTEIVAPD